MIREAGRDDGRHGGKMGVRAKGQTDRMKRAVGYTSFCTY